MNIVCDGVGEKERNHATIETSRRVVRVSLHGCIRDKKSNVRLILSFTLPHHPLWPDHDYLWPLVLPEAGSFHFIIALPRLIIFPGKYKPQSGDTIWPAD